MTQQQRRQVAIGVITAVLGAVVIAIPSCANRVLVSRPEYDLHVQTEQHEHEKTRQMLTVQQEISTELLCEVKPEHRRCR